MKATRKCIWERIGIAVRYMLLFSQMQGQMMKKYTLILALPVLLSAQVDFKLPDLNRDYQTYEDVKGEKLTVIDFWATWCAPCVRSFSELGKLSETYQNQGVAFVGINEDGPRNRSKVKPFVQSMKPPYPILVDENGDVMSAFNVTGLPTLLIIDSGNEIVFFHEGFKPGDENALKQALDELLGDAR